MIELLNNISVTISNNIFLAPAVALIAGFIQALMPCSLSQLPLLIAYLGGYEEGKKKAVKYSFFYVVGNSIVFIVLGILSALLGKSFSFLNKKIYLIFGIIMILMFLQMMNIVKIIPQSLKKPSTEKKGCLGAFILGIIGGFFSSPCSTPVLIAILSFVATSKNIVLGAIMLLFYSVGNAVIFLILGSSIKLTDKFTNSDKMAKIGKILNVIISIAVLMLGFYMFYLGF